MPPIQTDTGAYYVHIIFTIAMSLNGERILCGWRLQLNQATGGGVLCSVGGWGMARGRFVYIGWNIYIV